MGMEYLIMQYDNIRDEYQQVDIAYTLKSAIEKKEKGQKANPKYIFKIFISIG